MQALYNESMTRTEACLFPAVKGYSGIFFSFLHTRWTVGGSPSGKSQLIFAVWKEARFCTFPVGLSRFISLFNNPERWLLLAVHNLITAGMQHGKKSEMRAAGSRISWGGFWNRRIVCLHAGRGLGQTVPSFQDFKPETGKKRKKEVVVWSGSRRISCLQGVAS